MADGIPVYLCRLIIAAGVAKLGLVDVFRMVMQEPLGDILVPPRGGMWRRTSGCERLCHTAVQQKNVCQTYGASGIPGCLPTRLHAWRKRYSNMQVGAEPLLVTRDMTCAQE